MKTLIIILTLLTCSSCNKDENKTEPKSIIIKTTEIKSTQTKAEKKKIVKTSNINEPQQKSAKNIYLSKCISCHGVNGEGSKKENAPRIGGQYDWYIKSQIIAIKNNKRTNGNTKKMFPFVKSLTDKEINSLSKYISLLSLNK
ncbi:MAG: c-type cytochrome [Bdellovibrionales bacterium]|jgi:cytochrome c553|nr:c-type cytochrome [Bdellovibrionales bacterium]